MKGTKHSDNNTTSGGIGLGGAVFIVFLILKLLGNIDLSWWWVTGPLWMPLAAVLVFYVVMFLIYGIIYIVLVAIALFTHLTKG